jgi:hypothetical protein
MEAKVSGRQAQGNEGESGLWHQPKGDSPSVFQTRNSQTLYAKYSTKHTLSTRDAVLIYDFFWHIQKYDIYNNKRNIKGTFDVHMMDYCYIDRYIHDLIKQVKKQHNPYNHTTPHKNVDKEYLVNTGCCTRTVAVKKWQWQYILKCAVVMNAGRDISHGKNVSPDLYNILTAGGSNLQRLGKIINEIASDEYVSMLEYYSGCAFAGQPCVALSESKDEEKIKDISMSGRVLILILCASNL